MSSLRRLAAWVPVALSGWLAGCFVDLPTDGAVPSPCAGQTCSTHGFCDDGVCYCDPNHVGNAYAIHGCQPTGALSPCETTCGLNAYCDAGACRCAEGFVAVCGTGDCVASRALCDGSADCANAADEDPHVCFDGAVQEWNLIDACDDDADISWRVWAQDRDWVWPGPDDVFHGAGLDHVARETVECIVGELLCFGGVAGDRVWGVGLDGRGQCDGCCETCAPDVVEIGELTCE